MLIFKLIFGIMLYMVTQINSLKYGYKEDSYGYLCPTFINETNIPTDNFPLPCTFKKCASKTVCKCWKMQIPCCKCWVAQKKGNVQTHMIKNMNILITANIQKNIMLFSSLIIYIDHLLIHSCLSTLVENEHRKPQSTILFRVTPSHFLQSPKVNVKQNSVEPSDIFFLNQTPQWKATQSQ